MLSQPFLKPVLLCLYSILKERREKINKIHLIPRRRGLPSPADFSAREKPAHLFRSNLTRNDQLESLPVSSSMIPGLLPRRMNPGSRQVFRRPRRHGPQDPQCLRVGMACPPWTTLTARQCLQVMCHQTSQCSRTSLNQQK